MVEQLIVDAMVEQPVVEAMVEQPILEAIVEQLILEAMVAVDDVNEDGDIAEHIMVAVHETIIAEQWMEDVIEIVVGEVILDAVFGNFVVDQMIEIENEDVEDVEFDEPLMEVVNQQDIGEAVMIAEPLMEVVNQQDIGEAVLIAEPLMEVVNQQDIDEAVMIAEPLEDIGNVIIVNHQQRNGNINPAAEHLNGDAGW